ncbi:MAG TPA: hypothetical protein VGF84_19080 [Micromonosporaceae bacterium]
MSFIDDQRAELEAAHRTEAARRAEHQAAHEAAHQAAQSAASQAGPATVTAPARPATRQPAPPTSGSALPQASWPQQPPLPAAPPLSSPRCTICGCLPTANVDFRGQHGYVYVRRTFNYRGPFCRDCGIATFRRATATTLVGGWYGIISLVTAPFTLLANVSRRRRVAGLAAPLNPYPGRSPLSPGRPVYLRWQILGLLAPVALIALIVSSVMSSSHPSTDSAKPAVGSCVESPSGAGTVAIIVDCDQAHNGVVTKIVTSVLDCPGTTAYTLEDSTDPTDTSTYCVAASSGD